MHKFHIECILFNLFSFLNDEDCIDCRDSFFNLSKKACLLCGDPLEELRQNACKMSKYLCQSHISEYRKKEFCKDCFACQTPLTIKINKDDEGPKPESPTDENIEKKSTNDKSIEKQEKQEKEEEKEEKEEKVLLQELEISLNDEQLARLYQTESINFSRCLSSNSSMAKCSFCNSNADLANFCNHNYCDECLERLVREEFQEFLECYNQKNLARIKNKFAFKCRGNKCKDIFKIPFFEAERILGDEIRRFGEFAIYFEGGKTEFEICSQCRNVVGKCGGIKFGCDCR